MWAIILDILKLLIPGFVSITVALVASNGFWNRTEKKDGIKATLSNIQEEQKNIRNDMKRIEAKDARRRILRFNDELLNNVCHSKELFDDALEDIDTYDKFCADHPEFPNNKTVMAESNIRRCYQKCMEDQDFL